MAEVRAKKKLDEILGRLNIKTGSDEIMRLFRNTQQKYSHEKLFGFLQTYIKPHILDGDKMLAQYETNVKKLSKPSIDAFLLLLNNATVIQGTKPPIAEKPNINKLSAKSDGVFESPALSSTRYDINAPDIVVSEVI
jgi:hypothetical protein